MAAGAADLPVYKERAQVTPAPPSTNTERSKRSPGADMGHVRTGVTAVELHPDSSAAPGGSWRLLQGRVWAVMSLCGSGCRGQPTARSRVCTARRGWGGRDTIPQAPTAIGHPALSSPELLSLTVDCARRVPPPGIRYIENVRVNVGNPTGLHMTTPQVTHKGLGILWCFPGIESPVSTGGIQALLELHFRSQSLRARLTFINSLEASRFL